MSRKGIIMEISLSTLVVVAIGGLLISVALFFILRMKDKLSKFATYMKRPTLTLLFIVWLGILIDSHLDLFFLPCTLFGSIALLSMACFIGLLPMWIVVVILYFIKTDNSTNNDNHETTPKKLDKKTKKNMVLFGTIAITSYISGVIIQSLEHYPVETGKRNIFAVILLAVSVIICLTAIYKGKSKKKTNK